MSPAELKNFYEHRRRPADDELVIRSPVRSSGSEQSGPAGVDEIDVREIKMGPASRDGPAVRGVRHGLHHHREQVVIGDVDFAVHGYDTPPCFRPHLW